MRSPDERIRRRGRSPDPSDQSAAAHERYRMRGPAGYLGVLFDDPRLPFPHTLREYEALELLVEQGGLDSLISDLRTTREDLQIEEGWGEEGDDDDRFLDVQLNYRDGQGWGFHTGLYIYIADWNGHWGTGSVGTEYDEDNLLDTARSLIEDVFEDMSQDLEYYRDLHEPLWDPYAMEWIPEEPE